LRQGLVIGLEYWIVSIYCKNNPKQRKQQAGIEEPLLPEEKGIICFVFDL
jgi:hypothetical protein